MKKLTVLFLILSLNANAFEVNGGFAVTEGALGDECLYTNPELEAYVVKGASSEAQRKANEQCSPKQAVLNSEYILKKDCHYFGPFRSLYRLAIDAKADFICAETLDGSIEVNVKYRSLDLKP